MSSISAKWNVSFLGIPDTALSNQLSERTLGRYGNEIAPVQLSQQFNKAKIY